MIRIGVIMLVLSCLLFTACTKKSKVKELNRNITLWKNDKAPYGTWFAYNQLKQLFPKATINTSSKSPVQHPEITTVFNSAVPGSGKSAQIIISKEFYPDPLERQALLNYVWEGNQLFVSSFSIDQEFLDSLNLKMHRLPFEFIDNQPQKYSIENFATNETDSFSYPGFVFANFFQQFDSAYTSILGKNNSGQPNFIRIQYSNGGAIYIHSNPFQFTNFFLLHKENKKYYELAFSQIPERITTIEWNEYYRNNNRNNNSSSVGRALSWALKQPALAMALLLLLITFILIYIFDTKRKQRKLASIPPLRNTSLDFAQTIGQLYYQQHDNSNLAQKMSQHFYEHIRTHLNIPSSKVDDSFVNVVSFKTGIDQAELRSMLYLMKQLCEQPEVSDQEIILFIFKDENFVHRRSRF